MADSGNTLNRLRSNLKSLREKAGLSPTELDERLILGPGWIASIEAGKIIPSLDIILAILQQTGGTLHDLVAGLSNTPELSAFERQIFATEDGPDIILHFRYASFDANYRLVKASLAEFEDILKRLRDGLARLVQVPTDNQPLSETIKTDVVADVFLETVKLWPHINPSDIWWFLVYRAYCDPYNHPARFARQDHTQSWKRTGGWALEKVVVKHYGAFLETHGVRLYVADGVTKRNVVHGLQLSERLEADKIDLIITTTEGMFLGVVHVKASFAERRTDDVPMSIALKNAGYISPLWTMDCKSTPAAHPLNKGELGTVGERRSAKRLDIEQEGYFTGCFSYNRNTVPSPSTLPESQRIYVCDFTNPDDDFSRFIIRHGQKLLNR